MKMILENIILPIKTARDESLAHPFQKADQKNIEYIKINIDKFGIEKLSLTFEHIEEPVFILRYLLVPQKILRSDFLLIDRKSVYGGVAKMLAKYATESVEH